MKYFFLSGIKDVGKTECIRRIANYLTISYTIVASSAKLLSVPTNDDFIVLLERKKLVNSGCEEDNRSEYVLINSASDPGCDVILEKFMLDNFIFSKKHAGHYSINPKYADMTIISALRANYGGSNYSLRVAFESVMGITNRSTVSDLIDILMGSAESNDPLLSKDIKDTYCNAFYNMCLLYLTSHLFPYKL